MLGHGIVGVENSAATWTGSKGKRFRFFCFPDPLVHMGDGSMVRCSRRDRRGRPERRAGAQLHYAGTGYGPGAGTEREGPWRSPGTTRRRPTRRPGIRRGTACAAGLRGQQDPQLLDEHLALPAEGRVHLRRHPAREGVTSCSTARSPSRPRRARSCSRSGTRSTSRRTRPARSRTAPTSPLHAGRQCRTRSPASMRPGATRRSRPPRDARTPLDHTTPQGGSHMPKPDHHRGAHGPGATKADNRACRAPWRRSPPTPRRATRRAPPSSHIHTARRPRAT